MGKLKDAAEALRSPAKSYVEAGRQALKAAKGAEGMRPFRAALECATDAFCTGARIEGDSPLSREVLQHAERKVRSLHREGVPELPALLQTASAALANDLPTDDPRWSLSVTSFMRAAGLEPTSSARHAALAKLYSAIATDEEAQRFDPINVYFALHLGTSLQRSLFKPFYLAAISSVIAPVVRDIVVTAFPAADCKALEKAALGKFREAVCDARYSGDISVQVAHEIVSIVLPHPSQERLNGMTHVAARIQSKLDDIESLQEDSARTCRQLARVSLRVARPLDVRLLRDAGRSMVMLRGELAADFRPICEANYSAALQTMPAINSLDFRPWHESAQKCLEAQLLQAVPPRWFDASPPIALIAATEYIDGCVRELAKSLAANSVLVFS